MKGPNFYERINLLREFRNCDGAAVKIAFGDYYENISRELTSKELFELIHQLYHCDDWITEIAISQSSYDNYQEKFEYLKSYCQTLFSIKL